MAKSDNFSSKTIYLNDFLRKIKLGVDELSNLYIKSYGWLLEKEYPKPELIYLDGIARKTRAEIFSRFKPLKEILIATAVEYKVDLLLLTAILIDEYARIGPDDLFDFLTVLGNDTSSGLAQVKLTTAKLLIVRKYFPTKRKISDFEIYKILNDDRGAIKMAAAYLKYAKDYRKKKKLKISVSSLASCYSSRVNKEKVTVRGSQIVEKLIPLA